MGRKAARSPAARSPAPPQARGSSSGGTGGSIPRAARRVAFIDDWTKCQACASWHWNATWCEAGWKCRCGAQVEPFRRRGNSRPPVRGAARRSGRLVEPCPWHRSGGGGSSDAGSSSLGGSDFSVFLSHLAAKAGGEPQAAAAIQLVQRLVAPPPPAEVEKPPDEVFRKATGLHKHVGTRAHSTRCCASRTGGGACEGGGTRRRPGGGRAVQGGRCGRSGAAGGGVGAGVGCLGGAFHLSGDPAVFTDVACFSPAEQGELQFLERSLIQTKTEMAGKAEIIRAKLAASKSAEAQQRSTRKRRTGSTSPPREEGGGFDAEKEVVSEASSPPTEADGGSTIAVAAKKLSAAKFAATRAARAAAAAGSAAPAAPLGSAGQGVEACGFVEESLGRFHSFACVETHVRAGQFEKRRWAARKLDLRIPANHARRGHYTHTLEGSCDSSLAAPGAEAADGFQAGAIHLKGQRQVVVVTFYGISGVGWSGSSLRRFAKLGGLLQALQAPWFVLGDFNLPCQVLQKADFLRQVGARVLQANAATTCDAGPSGSHIDHGLCSDSCAPMLAGIWAAAAPWGTRGGLVVELRSGHDTLLGRQLQLAKGLPQVQRPRGVASSSRRGRRHGDAERRALARKKELDIHDQLFGSHVREREVDELSTRPGSASSDDGGDSIDEEAGGHSWAVPPPPAGQAAARMDEEEADPFDDLDKELEVGHQNGDELSCDPTAGPSDAAPLALGVIGEGPCAPPGSPAGGGSARTAMKGPLAASAAAAAGGAHIGQLSAWHADWVEHVERAVGQHHRKPVHGRRRRSQLAQRAEVKCPTSAAARNEPLRSAAPRWWSSVAALLERACKLRRRRGATDEDARLLAAAGRELLVLRRLLAGLGDIHSVADDVLAWLVEAAQAAASSARQKEIQGSLRRFRQWIAQAEATPLVFRSLKERHVAADELLIGDRAVVHPCEVLDHKASAWERLWAPQAIDMGEVLDLFSDLRDQAQFSELADIKVDDIRRALQRMRAKTGKGVDQLTVSDLAWLPDAALQELADLCAAADMVTRCWSMVREDAMREWSRRTAPARGAAIAGNSALREAFAGAVSEEAFAAMGVNYGHGLIDVQKFYDSMPWVGLARAALSCGFPPAVLALELQQCMAGRVLLQDGMASRFVIPCQSVVQGARSGTRIGFGRRMTYHALQRLTIGSPQLLPSRIWVDDLSLSAAGTRQSVAGALAQGRVEFGDGARQEVGVQAAASYGHEVDGVFGSRLAELRRCWFEVWRGCQEVRRRLARAWTPIHARLREAEPERRSRLARGPVSGLQALLLQHGRAPVGPMGWERVLADGPRERWAFPDAASIAEGSCKQVIDALEDACSGTLALGTAWLPLLCRLVLPLGRDGRPGAAWSSR
ncbi:unnamed protein product [Prorocentrum cordatum]|uniref:Uncharacterized protein n=1 Tax=Prorocentrum cordatum TaxID=2364126 RepID=A0ABN9R8F9_9DINO|nr:unnamed protein product [Polarella glacialis]